MKNLMKILSIFLLIVMSCTLIMLLFDGITADFAVFTIKLLLITVISILPIISLSLNCFCLERGDDNFLLRIINIYMTGSIVLAGIIVFFYPSTISSSISDITNITSTSITSSAKLDGFGDFLVKVYDFVSSTHLCVALFSLLFVVQENNSISSLIKKIAYGAIIINIVLALWLTIKTYMQETLPNVYDYQGYYGYSSGFNFASTSDTEIFIQKVYYISIIVESFAVVTLFITNYAFSSSTEIVASEIDYDELKKEASLYATKQINGIYNEEASKQMVEKNIKKELPKEEKQPGVMNISNQLGNDSNVGQVTEAAKTAKVITDASSELSMPFRVGPVINENALENTQKLGIVATSTQPQPQPQPEQTIAQAQQAPTQPKYQDINTMMSNQMQQAQPQVQQQVQPQIQQAQQTDTTNNQDVEML